MRIAGFAAALLSMAVNGTLVEPEQLPLATSGKWVVDAQGNKVKLQCIAWFGAHQDRFANNGLDLVQIDELAADIAAKGFNCVRLPFSIQQWYDDPIIANDVLAA